MKTWVIINDLQIPFQSKPVVKLWLSFVRDLKPHGVILNGDIVDSYTFSTFHKDPLNSPSLKTEIAGAHALLGEINDIKSIKELWWLGGNHEDRHRRYMWAKAPELAQVIDFAKIFDLEDYNCMWKEYGEILQLGDLMVTHGNVVRAHSAWTAKKNFETYGSSVLTGHTHRLGVYFRTNSTGLHAAWENGCMCRKDLDYVKTPYPDWHHGFSVVHVADKGGTFHVQQIPILGERWFYYGSKLWGKR